MTQTLTLLIFSSCSDPMTHPLAHRLPRRSAAGTRRQHRGVLEPQPALEWREHDGQNAPRVLAAVRRRVERCHPQERLGMQAQRHFLLSTLNLA